jgi:hypothetical protein
MHACLTRSRIPGSGTLLDKRYFYRDAGGFGYCTCGLARQAMVDFLRQNAEESVFLGPEWFLTLEAFKDNLSVVGYTIEAMLIARLASTGLNAGNFCIKKSPIVGFSGDWIRFPAVVGSKLYVPARSNFKAIDAIYLDIPGDPEKPAKKPAKKPAEDASKRKAIVIAIQIASGKHNDTEAAFFAGWRNWVQSLGDFEIEVWFLWIQGDERDRAEIEEKVISLRGREVMAWPKHTTRWVSISQIDVDIGSTLAGIRKRKHKILHPEEIITTEVEDVGAADEGGLIHPPEQAIATEEGVGAADEDGFAEGDVGQGARTNANPGKVKRPLLSQTKRHPKKAKRMPSPEDHSGPRRSGRNVRGRT